MYLNFPEPSLYIKTSSSTSKHPVNRKDMHSMGMMETQLQLTTQQLEVLQKALKDVITAMVEEKSQIERIHKLIKELLIFLKGFIGSQMDKTSLCMYT